MYWPFYIFRQGATNVIFPRLLYQLKALLCRLYQIKLGTLEMENSADTEWVLRPYMNTAKKKTTLSDVDGWEVDT